MADSIRATPQNPTLGAIAAALRRAQQFTGQYQVDPRIPLLGGTGLDELLSLPGAASLMEDVSYNGPRALIRGGNVATGGIGTFRPDPRVADVADVAMNVTPLGMVASKAATKGAMAAGRAGERLAERVVPQVMEQGGFGAQALQALSGGTRSQVVKPKGGNWLAGSVEDAVRPLHTSNAPVLSGEDINAAAGRDIFSEYRKAYDSDMTLGLHEWTRKNYPEVYAQLQGPEAAAADRFVDKKLKNYLRNDMGTPGDPVRALAERGVLHYDPARVYPNSPMEADILAGRKAGGFPVEGLGEGDLARRWEDLSDYAITQRSAEDLVRQAETGRFGGERERAQMFLEKDPWLAKADPETKVYGTRYDAVEQPLGFEHLIEELKFSMDPTSGLPQQLRFDPKDIDKLTVPQAVERVAKINAWRAEQAAQAEKAGMMANLQATPRMADEGLQLSFVDKPGGAWVDIPETVDEQGMKLCNSIGKAGGWCTQHEWAATSYGSGDNRLTALVDAEGRPHAQAKITENPWPVSGETFTRLDPQTRAQYREHVREWRQRNPDVEELTDEDVVQALKEAGVQGPAPDITELKPVGNSFDSDRAKEYMKRDPEYKQKVTDSVLKFLNSGEWGKVNDLNYYDIVDLQNSHSVLRILEKMGGRSAREVAPYFNELIEFEPDLPRFMTRNKLADLVKDLMQALDEGPGGYAGGGLVKGAVKSIGEMVEKYLAKEAPQAAPKEQKMLMGVYRGYAGEDPAPLVHYHGGTYVPGEPVKQPLYLTRDPELARSYADVKGGSVVKVDPRPRKTAPQRTLDELAAEYVPENARAGYTPASALDAALHGERAVNRLQYELGRNPRFYDSARGMDIGFPGLTRAAPEAEALVMLPGSQVLPVPQRDVFATPQRRIAEYYAKKRAAQTGAEPHLEMLLVDPFAGGQYGHAIPIDRLNRDVNYTRARKLKPEDVQDRTKLYAGGGAVSAPTASAYDPDEIDTIVSQLKEEFHA